MEQQTAYAQRHLLTTQIQRWRAAAAHYTLPHPRRPRPALRPGQLIHVGTRLRVPARWLGDPRCRRIIAQEVAHYARACHIAVVHIALQDDALHLVLHLRAESAPLHVMIGTLKAQCSRKLKRAMCVDRDAFELAGSLWRERYAVRVLHHEDELGACVFHLYGRRRDRAAYHPLARRSGRIATLLRSIWGRVRPDKAPSQDHAETANAPSPAQTFREASITCGEDAQWSARRPSREQRREWRAVRIGGMLRWMRATPGSTPPPYCSVWLKLGVCEAERWALVEATDTHTTPG